MNKEIYLDNAATTKPYDEVIDRMSEVMKFDYGNPSSIHKKGRAAQAIVKSASETIAAILNCTPEEIVFTSGGAESNNLAVLGTYKANKGRGKHIITSKHEHATILGTCNDLELEGALIDYISIDKSGHIMIDTINEYLNEQTLLVSLMHVNSETGAICDLEKASKIVKEYDQKILFHGDNVQGFCKLPMDLAIMNNIDLLSISGHKIKGPKGIGALYVRKRTNIKSVISGNAHSKSLRAGTLNSYAIAGFQVAAEISYKNMKSNYDQVLAINNYAKNNMLEQIDDIIINCSDNKSPYVLNVGFKGIRSEVLLNYLSGKNIYVSAGSACSSKKKTDSHVLMAMMVPEEYIGGSLRFSFNYDTTTEEIDCLIKEIKEVLPMLRMVRRK